MPKNKKIFYTLLIFALLAALLFYFMPNIISELKNIDNKNDGKAEVIFMDVGQGDAILIQKDWTQILIDGGDGQQILNRLGEFMPLGDKKVELVIATHSDEDHMGGLIKVLESYEVEKVLEPGTDCDKDLCQKWEELITQYSINESSAKLGQEVNLGEDIKISVLYPFDDLSGRDFENANEASIVLKAEVDGEKYLLMGDTETKIEQELIDSGLDLDADVLKVSHHGSKNATSVDFISAVTPDQAVISVGENSYGHPSEETLNRLLNMNIIILRTDKDGSIEF